MDRNLDTILNLKRAKFLAVVKRICRARHIEEPIVNFDYCEGEDENQLAHMHPDSGQICVSERQLTKLNFDDIENTAAHEMAHFFEENHGPKFADEHMINSIASFRPGAGVTFTSENSSRRFKKPLSHNKKPDKTSCNYHLCRERVRLFTCNYCERYFCKKHLEPKLSGMPRFNDDSQEARIFRDEYRREDAHPCVPYFDFKEAKLKRQAEVYGNVLDKLLRMVPIPQSPYSESELSKLPVSQKKPKQIKKEKASEKPKGKVVAEEPKKETEKQKVPFPKIIYVAGFLLLIGLLMLINYFINN